MCKNAKKNNLGLVVTYGALQFQPRPQPSQPFYSSY